MQDAPGKKFRARERRPGNVCVGIDVHRKRSQVAVVTEDGMVQLNKNVVNGSEPMLRLIGDPCLLVPLLSCWNS